jgi:hypothetical protein
MSANPPKSSGRGARSLPSKLPRRTSADVKKRAVIEVIELTGLHPRQAAMSVGISSTSYYRLVEADPEFREALDSATAVYARRMAASVARAASALGSWKAAAWWLERRMGDVYGPKDKLAIEFDTPTLEDRIAADNTAEELDARLDLLAEEILRRRRIREDAA